MGYALLLVYKERRWIPLEYITVKKAAEKWGVSERLAQRYCTAGRVEGAIKFNGTWAIPPYAEKPITSRREDEMSDAAFEASVPIMHTPMPLLNTPFPLGHAKEAAEAFSDPDARQMALAEYYYFSGQAVKASELAQPLLEHQDIALKLSACWIYAYSNLALDRPHHVRKVLEHINDLKKHITADTPAPLRALAVCVSTAATILLHLPLAEDAPPIMLHIHQLPPGLRLFALYVQAHQAYLKKNYGASIGMVETALALEGVVYPIPTIYLHLVATMDYMSMKMPEMAKKHLLAAWELVQPDDLIEALGEHHGLLGGMIESVIKKDSPEDFKRIIAITYSFSAGWREIHNSATGNSVADNLTTTEFAACMLAARDWSNKEIAAHMGISENTVKHYIATALQKLNISQRKELKRFMLS